MTRVVLTPGDWDRFTGVEVRRSEPGDWAGGDDYEVDVEPEVLARWEAAEAAYTESQREQWALLNAARDAAT